MRTLLPALALALAITPLAALGDEPAIQGDLAKLQGRWTATIGPEKNVRIMLTFKGVATTFGVSLPDGTEYESKGEIKVDESARPFKTINFVKFAGPKGEISPENLGIYDFEGDDLKLCTGGPGNGRPDEFKASEDGPTLVILKRKAEPKNDLARFQGKWSARVGPNQDIPLVMTIKDTAVTHTINAGGGERETKFEIKIDESARPKAIDFVKLTRSDGSAVPDNPGIYEFDGDSLRICMGGPNNERPKEFKGDEGAPFSLLVFKREKE